MWLYIRASFLLSTDDDATLDSVVCERDSADVINHKVCGQLAASASAPTPGPAAAWAASKRHIKFQLPQIFFSFDLLPPFVPEANLSLGRSIRVFMPADDCILGPLTRPRPSFMVAIIYTASTMSSLL